MGVTRYNSNQSGRDLDTNRHSYFPCRLILKDDLGLGDLVSTLYCEIDG